jgi:PD-(D/E)XK nuclease superfamily
MFDPLSFSIPLPTSPPRPAYPKRQLLQRINETHDYILEIDYSSISKYINCPRAGENYLIHSRESDRPSSATDFGKLFHECEELRLYTGFSPAVTARQRELVMEHFMRYPCSPTDHRTAERMLAVLALYEERYAHDEWHLKVVQHEGEPFIERPFKIPLCTIPVDAYVVTRPTYDTYIGNIHVIYTGRIDAAIHDSGAVWIMDNKTSSRGGAEFESAFRLSQQTRGYTWALQKILGTPVAGLIMNALVIKPPTLKIYNNTELQRITYHYSQDSLHEWEDNMRATVTDLVASLIRGYFPQTGLSFKSPCSGCDYVENCQLPREQRATDLASDIYRDVTWSPIH